MAWLFGDFTLDPERRQLFRAGTPLPLEPKAYELLNLLVARRPRALSKAQIHEVLWPGTFVSESALAGLVADLRAVLHDDARRPRFIRTVHGFGYAFRGETIGRISGVGIHQNAHYRTPNGRGRARGPAAAERHGRLSHDREPCGGDGSRRDGPRGSRDWPRADTGHHSPRFGARAHVQHGDGDLGDVWIATIRQ